MAAAGGVPERGLERGRHSTEMEGVAEATGGESGGAVSGMPLAAAIAAQIASLSPEALRALEAMVAALRRPD